MTSAVQTVIRQNIRRKTLLTYVKEMWFLKDKYSITESLSKEMIEKSIDLSIDYAEIPIDILVSDDVIKEIPVVKTVFALAKTGVALQQMYFVKKLMTFLKEFHLETVSPAKIEEFRHKMTTDKTYSNRVTEQVVVMLDRIISERKASLIAKLLLAYIEGIYDWGTYTDLTTCIDSMFSVDFRLIKLLFDHAGAMKLGDIKYDTIDKHQVYASIQRMKTFAFIELNEGRTWDEIDSSLNEKVQLSEFGKRFYLSCLKPD